MRFLCSSIFLLAPFLIFSQDTEWRKTIDSNVRRIEGCHNNVSTFTKVEAINGREAEINYQYRTCKGFGARIERKYSNRDSAVRQIFYEWDAQLIYSIEHISYYHGRDSSSWRGTYYFSNGRLRDYETLGHGKSETNAWNPETEVSSNYRTARNDIRSFLVK